MTGIDGTPESKANLGNELALDKNTLAVIESIDGKEIESQLIELARIGGERIKPMYGQKERYATNRPALSPQDRLAQQEFIIPQMETAGAKVHIHPLGVMGTYEGTDPSLAPVVIMSHTDTVPSGDMYDGTTGVIGGIATVKAMNEAGFQPRRNVMVLSLTGEESARFNFALFGSRAIFQGLSDAELAATDQQGQSIAEVLGETDARTAKVPLFGTRSDLTIPSAVIELHVEQGTRLEESGINIGVVESIAAPVRYKATVGDTSLSPDDTSPPHSRYLELSVDGIEAHSGATPMGHDQRADGLLETISYLQQALNEYKGVMPKVLSIGDILIDNQSINKVPGRVRTTLRIGGDNAEEVEEAVRFLRELENNRNQLLSESEYKFGKNPIKLSKIKSPQNAVFFKPEDILPRQRAAFGLIRAVNNAALSRAEEGVVGTVGTFETTDDGRIILGLDIRGEDMDPRKMALDEISFETKALGHTVSLGEPLPGSGDPVRMDVSLVESTIDVIDRFEIGSVRRMSSAAGHDAQNAARAGIPAVMLFAPSRRGIAHNPEAYTSPEDLQRNVRALAALVIELASR
ncbi:MAG TPA: M20/M25/M40 family metallo-hydrolase [Candidatus Saccharimonadales bacterium]|nr:M20/M25/M40 family metallo-hydrolase [Candidatus Saccharimonadales bacterium]